MSVILNKESKKQTAFIQVRNTVVHQQVVLLSLLNSQFSFLLRLPNKKSLVYDQNFSIDSITDAYGNSFDFNSFVQIRVEQRLSIERGDGIPEKTLSRRRQNYIIAERTKFLVDLLREAGYFISTVETGGKKNMLKTEIVTQIFYNGVLMFDKDAIRECGRVVSHNITTLKTMSGKIQIPINTIALKSYSL
ncbi:hypothetical protein EIN_115080 [Entamoeba invadens IP1]|uniref:Uncharacterized protein n=1 Tax=Entamoeba invadens IP1 TaxID=370355 RepID=A0A0A1U3W0_ENTIV|nr:hypothetical protein EIN_115080 [Entamoeba invadens IP1]ELP86294.1 hypothetical protein EIN_115080 [Entamoeba invadens IP1]|eukprot:XP_004185640.1 hypothetical protein EIN_115080 [Entamoeba invadens IP1]